MVPKAIEVINNALSSGDERISVTVATKLVEGLQAMPRGGSGQIDDMANQASSSSLGEVHGHYAGLAQMMAMMMEKSDTYGIPLPEQMVPMREAADAAALTLLKM